MNDISPVSRPKTPEQNSIKDQWAKMIHNEMASTWYDTDQGGTVYADYLYCKRDFENGNKRARQYMQKFVKYRLIGD